MKLRRHHIDIDDECAPVVCVGTSERLCIQIEMIRDHMWLLGIPTMDEAAMHWVETGLAEKFAQHYITTERI